MTRADELLARVLRRSFRPLAEMPESERSLVEALAHGGLSKNRRNVILDALCQARRTYEPAKRARPLEKFSSDDLVNELCVYRHDLPSFTRAAIKVLAKR